MMLIYSIQIVQDALPASLPFIHMSWFNQPIDVLLYQFLIWFGWIPVLATFVWGFSEIWLNDRQSMYAAKQKFIMLAIDVPAMTEQTPKALENMFNTLFAAKSSATFKEKWFDGKFLASFSFEIISEGGYIQFLIRTQAKFRDVIEAGIYAQYPDAEIAEVEDYAADIPRTFPNDKIDMWGAEFTFDKPSFFPIRTYVDFEDQMTGEIKDPLGYTLEQLSKMHPGEHFWFQLVIQPSSQDWKKKGVDHVNKIFGIEEKAKVSEWSNAVDSVVGLPFEFLAHATGVDLADMFGLGGEVKKEADPWKAFKLGTAQQEEAKAILRKTVKIGFGAKIRLVYWAEKPAFRKGDRVTMIKGILNQYTHLNMNSFKMHGPSIPKDDYPWQLWTFDKKKGTLLNAYRNRSWSIGADPMFLNTEELATLWHFPTISAKAPLIKKAEARRAEPPVGLPVTFLENTLETHGADKLEALMQIAQEEPELFAKNDFPSMDALPHVQSPTKKHEKKKNDTEDDGTFAPPNLPI